MEEPANTRIEPDATPWAERFRILAPLIIIGLIGFAVAALYIFHDRAAVDARPKGRDLAQEARDDLDKRNFRPLSAPLAALLNDPKYESVPTQAHPLLMQPAPDFTLSDANGNDWSLKQRLVEGPVVIVFYYGYFCNHCVSQLFALNKDLEKFRELGVTVVALSPDPPELTRERYKRYGVFDFAVLSDPGNKVARQFETYFPNPKPGEDGDLLHGSFVVSKKGTIVWVNRGEGPFTENRTLLIEAARADARLTRPPPFTP